MTITVRLPQDLEAALRARLDVDGEALSEFVRQAIAEKLARAGIPSGNPSAYELGAHLFGKYESGRSDLAERSEEILREQLSAKHRR